MNQASVATSPQQDEQRPVPAPLQPSGVKTLEFVTRIGSAAEVLDETQTQHVIRPKVMIVDDEPINIEVLQDFLGEAGYRRFAATSDATEAMAMLAVERPDVLLLDLMMPHVSGFDILKSMQADQVLKHIPVIILTASSDPDHKLDALELGACDFLAKPVDPSELVLRMRNTLAAKAYQDRLANYDALTGLPNRRKYIDHLEWALENTKREKALGAALHIGVDRFKQINEAYGPATGDRLLRDVARRLRQCLHESAPGVVPGDAVDRPSLSRLGNDEFAVLLPVIADTAAAGVVAERMVEAVALPYHVAGSEIYLTCSVGISVFPNDSEETEGILQDAGVAMHHAKQQGKNHSHFYSQGLNSNSRQRLILENDLRKALDRDEMRLHYQPKFDVKSGRLVGAEALLRWQHAERGLVGPLHFIPVAEESGLIVPLGEWVLHAACSQIRSWQSAGLDTPHIAVNVSGHQFRTGRLSEAVRSAIEVSGVDPRFLTLEITESVIMENMQQNLQQLVDIKASGVQLSIDDFGTGYSSLSYLMRFPLDELKIDRSFLATIGDPRDKSSIVVAIIAIAHSLGLKVVAEGIEKEDQLEFLKTHGCDEMQGYLFSKPVPADEFGAMLSTVLTPLHAQQGS